jgi:hypothetical protein
MVNTKNSGMQVWTSGTVDVALPFWKLAVLVLPEPLIELGFERH